MSEASVLAAGRAAAERRMTSTCTIRRPAVDEDGNPVRVKNADGYTEAGLSLADVHVGIPCQIKGAAAYSSPSRAVTIGDVQVQAAARILKLKWDTTDLRDGDYVAITSGVCAGRYFRLVDSTPADDQTAVRVQIIETEQPEGWS